MVIQLDEEDEYYEDIKISLKARQKMSKRAKERWKNSEYRQKIKESHNTIKYRCKMKFRSTLEYRQKLKESKNSIEYKNKCSERTKERWKNSEYRQKMFKAKRKGWKKRKENKTSLETRQRMSDSHKRRWKNPILIQKMKRLKNTIEYKSKCSEKFREMWKNLEFRQYMIGVRAKRVLPVKDTGIEIKIQTYLKLLGVEFFTHQYIKDIKHSYQCDIFIPSLRLVVECDGNYWHNYPMGRNIDHIRTRELIEAGYKVLRLWESEINIMTINSLKELIQEENICKIEVW